MKVLTHYETQTEDEAVAEDEAAFEKGLRPPETYYVLDSTLATKLADLARQRGVSAETLLNLLVYEKLQEWQVATAA
ncbi:MAG: hypothetical protein AB1791_14540 [Chloroflexota bacterium]